MGALHRFEQRLEQVVTGAFARAFRSAVQPMEIAAALQREVDNSAQILSRDRRLAPNDFTIDLSGTDYDRLSTYGQTLSAELASMLHEHAREQHYVFTGPVILNFQRADDLTTGRFRVRSAASAQVTPAPGQSVTDTAVRRSSAYLGIGELRHPLVPPGLVVGRGSNADLKINDPGVSRRHVEFRVASSDGQPSVSLVDLGSTNGTLVNGHRVQHALLADGSVVQIGGTRITLHVIADAAAAPPGPREPTTPPAPGPPEPAAPSGGWHPTNPGSAPQRPAPSPDHQPAPRQAPPATQPTPPSPPTATPPDPGRQHWSG